MPRTSLLLLLGLTLSSCASYAPPRSASPSESAHAATTPVPPDAPALPDTPLGRIAGEWLDALNSGSSEPLEAFVVTRYAARALQEQSADERIRRMRTLQLQSGGLDLVEVTPAAGQMPMTMLVRSRHGNRYARVIMGSDPADAEKLAGSGVERSDAPAAERALRWPQTALAEPRMIEAIRDEIDRRDREGTFSGVVLIARGDTILLHEARGWADREAQIPNSLDTKFHLASVGKMFTAASIAQLVQAGKLSYDAKIIDVLPQYPNRDVASKVTLHHLLTHSGGLGTFFGSPGFVPGRLYASSADQIAVFQEEPLFFEPGTRWRYSNAGYAVLGAIIEAHAGVPYADYLRQHIFDPLGMDHTYTDTATEAPPSVSVFYTQSDDDPLGLEPFIPDHDLKTSGPNGFGGGFSTAADLFRFLRALRTGRLLGEEMTAAMIEPQLDVNGRGSTFVTRGLYQRKMNGVTVLGHAGGGRADAEMLWEEDYTIVVLANATPPPVNAFVDEIADFITKQASMR